MLATLAAEAGDSKRAFTGQRILICHSGGDSRRTPAYAAQGKVFTPVPTTPLDCKPLALFDLILRTVSALPAPAAGQVLITSGDVLLTFDHGSVDFTRPGITGVAYFGSTERGSRHGVYVPENFCPNPQRAECVAVADFLQKPSEAEARACGAVDPFGHVAIDTGLLSLDPTTCAHLLCLAGVDSTGNVVKQGLLADVVAGRCPALDLYDELTMALAPKVDEARFLNRFVVSRGHLAAQWRRMQTFYRAARSLAFQVNIVPYCDFFHIGSSRELLAGFSGLSRTAQTYHFENRSGACLTGGGDLERAFIFNARIDAPVCAGNALLESVFISAQCPALTLAGDNILTGLPPEATVAITLPKRTGLVCLPIGKAQWTAVVYGLDDDFKTAFGGEAPCCFLNAPIERWMARSGRQARHLWRDDMKDGLWQARIWRVGTLNEVIADAVAIAAQGTETTDLPQQTAATHPLGGQVSGKRYALAELLPRVNHSRLLAVRQEIWRQVSLMQMTQRLLANDRLPAHEMCGWIQTIEEARHTEQQLANLLTREALGQPLLAARVLRLMALVRTAWPKLGDAQHTLRQAFDVVAESVAMSFEPIIEPQPAAILHDQVVWVTTPVRIDFAGGWSDTPPICTELGGTVLNAAVTLNGMAPIQVMAKLNTVGLIRLSSIDLGERQEFSKTTELLDHSNPMEWSTLAKAALVLTGIAPAQANQPLAAWLKKLGGGLDLTIFSSLPKGSGMGTSSLLGAAVIACLERVLGKSFNSDRLIRMTSILEQRMCTGGGWQDQVGGIFPGVKLIRTQPGADQTVSCRWTVFNMSEGSALKQRCLLYFTGQKRMARNILQNVVAGYLARDPALLRNLQAVGENAQETKAALDAQDIDAFAQSLQRTWALKKQIDPASTNKPIEQLLKRVANETQAALLPGAGGGGFIFMLAKSGAAATRIKQIFERNPPNAQARFFDFDVDQQGLKITVL